MEKKNAWLVAAAVSAVALLYPISIIFKLRTRMEEALRWIQNDPTFNIFMPFFFSLAIGIFLASADFKPITALGQYKKFSYGMLTFLLILATLAVASTFDRPALEPFLFKDADAALTKESAIRQDLRQAYRDLATMRDAQQRHAAKERLSERRDRAIKAYVADFAPFGKVQDFVRRGSYCAWLALLINAMAGGFVAVIFWYLWNLVIFRSALRSEAKEWIVVVVGLLVFWFPLRLYAEWYIGMYSFTTMKHYYVFIFLGIVALAAYGFCIFSLAKSMSVKLFSALGTGLLALMGIVGKVNPTWLGITADFIEDMPFKWFLASLFILISAMSAMVLSVAVEPGFVATPVERRRKGRRRPKERSG